MARPLRIQFAGAIYHAVARGNGKQLLFHSDDDYQRMLSGLEKTVYRTGWEVFAFVWMPNHIHLFFRTPRPNLSKGMQYLLSGYANWYAKRHQRPGHLFQGRFKGKLVKDNSYFWNVSRYMHLNPTRGHRSLVNHPRDWLWSSYRGYARKSDRLDWLCYDRVYRSWQGEIGGKSPEGSYRRFVESELGKLHTSPFASAYDGWLLGSDKFVDRVKKLTDKPCRPDQVRQARRLTPSSREVIHAVAHYYGVSPDEYAMRRSNATGRDLADSFGLSHPDSVSNLTRRAERALAKSRKLRSDLGSIEKELLDT